MSRIDAPSSANLTPSSPAASADAKRPPSLKESGVTFRIAMTPGSEPRISSRTSPGGAMTHEEIMSVDPVATSGHSKRE